MRGTGIQEAQSACLVRAIPEHITWGHVHAIFGNLRHATSDADQIFQSRFTADSLYRLQLSQYFLLIFFLIDFFFTHKNV